MKTYHMKYANIWFSLIEGDKYAVADEYPAITLAIHSMPRKNVVQLDDVRGTWVDIAETTVDFYRWNQKLVETIPCQGNGTITEVYDCGCRFEETYAHHDKNEGTPHFRACSCGGEIHKNPCHTEHYPCKRHRKIFF